MNSTTRSMATVDDKGKVIKPSIFSLNYAILQDYGTKFDYCVIELLEFINNLLNGVQNEYQNT
jgi:hypothetical protein